MSTISVPDIDSIRFVITLRFTSLKIAFKGSERDLKQFVSNSMAFVTHVMINVFNHSIQVFLSVYSLLTIIHSLISAIN